MNIQWIDLLKDIKFEAHHIFGINLLLLVYLEIESTHLLIFHSIIIYQEFNGEKSNNWILLYNDLKKYLFVSLCEKQFSNIALSILKKIFSFWKILKELLESTFDLFISTMKIIYRDEVMDEPHENMKTLLAFISEIKSENNDCKGYVYRLIKTFSIQNDKKYLKVIYYHLWILSQMKKEEIYLMNKLNNHYFNF